MLTMFTYINTSIHHPFLLNLQVIRKAGEHHFWIVQPSELMRSGTVTCSETPSLPESNSGIVKRSLNEAIASTSASTVSGKIVQVITLTL